MKTLTKLDALLNDDFSDDFWGDVGIETGCEIISNLKVDEWKILSLAWRNKSVKWQCRFANLLDGVEGKYGVPVLFSMLASEEDEVVLSAIDSLDGLDDSFENNIKFAGPSAIKRLIGLKNTADKDEAELIQEIILRIESTV